MLTVFTVSMEFTMIYIRKGGITRGVFSACFRATVRRRALTHDDKYKYTILRVIGKQTYRFKLQIVFSIR